MPVAPPPSPADSPVPPAGRTLGNYRLESLLGEGGVGKVFLATHVHLGRRVAVKTLKKQYTSDRAVLKRFFQEAQAINRIQHPNVVEVADLVDSPEATFIVMEYLQGQTLGARARAQGALRVFEAVGIARQIVSALAAIHAADIIHRDLKPDNIFLVRGPDGGDVVKLLDFGLAKLIKPLKQGESLLTNPDTLLGTPEYMAPEQVTNQALNGKADIYSLGVILYLLLSGRRPLEGRSYGDLLVKIATTQPEPLADVMASQGLMLPESLGDLVMRCLLKAPLQRPSAAELAVLLASPECVLPPTSDFVTRRVSPLPPPPERKASTPMPSPTGSAPAPHAPARRRLWIGLGALLAALVVVAALAAVLLTSRSAPLVSVDASIVRADAAAPSFAKLTQLWRTVELDRKPNGWRRVEEVTMLRAGDGIKTGAGARAELVFAHGARLELSEASELRLDDRAGQIGVTVISGIARLRASDRTVVLHARQRVELRSGQVSAPKPEVE